MDLDVFEGMDRAALGKYLEFLLWHYRVVDAFWFLQVAERFDQSTRKGKRQEKTDELRQMQRGDQRAGRAGTQRTHAL